MHVPGGRIGTPSPTGRKGCIELRLRETSGKPIASWAAVDRGRARCWNVPNGNLASEQGRVTINGIDVHAEADRVRRCHRPCQPG